jgi:hypothetical protein
MATNLKQRVTCCVLKQYTLERTSRCDIRHCVIAMIGGPCYRELRHPPFATFADVLPLSECEGQNTCAFVSPLISSLAIRALSVEITATVVLALPFNCSRVQFTSAIFCLA